MQECEEMKRFVAIVVTLVGGCVSRPNLQTADAVDAGPAASDEASSSSAPLPAPDGEATPDPDAALEAGADTAPPPVCDGRCATAGGTCNGDTCVIACPGAASCATTVKCPPDMPCTVQCVGHEACQNVECVDATACSITCDGDHACHDKVTCKGLVCEVSCANGGCSLDGVQCCASACTVNGATGKCG